jgi:hypothetical protein
LLAVSLICRDRIATICRDASAHDAVRTFFVWVNRKLAAAHPAAFQVATATGLIRAARLLHGTTVACTDVRAADD